MADRSALGPADVDDDRLLAMVADQLGVPAADVVLHEASVEPVAYDVPAITTASRHWVRGTAGTPSGPRDWAFVVKVVQSWSRHPFFAFVPEEMREVAAAGVPWRTEPDVYRSDLADRLPRGLTAPRAAAVLDVDELSAAVWLPGLPVVEVPWDVPRYVRAAHLLGRLAASTRVRALPVGHRIPVHTYLHGRLAAQVLPALADDDLWQHPLLVETFAGVRDELRAAGARAGEVVDELAAMPSRAAHGDACPNNLLAVAGGDPDGFVLIDYGFWGPNPVGFDLGQLLVGDVQTGARPADDLAERGDACLLAYVDGLRAEGDDVPEDVVRRAHALQLLVYAGLSTPPFELLGEAPTPARLAVATERAAMARRSLDLVAQTA